MALQFWSGLVDGYGRLVMTEAGRGAVGHPPPPAEAEVATVCVEYRLPGTGGEAALALRNAVSARIEAMLSREGLGRWDGGSLGMGRYESFFATPTPERALERIGELLAATPLAAEVRVYRMGEAGEA